MTKLTLGDLTQIARDFLRDEYGLSLGIPIKRNNRLSRSQGRFIEVYDEEIGGYVPDRIEISGTAFTHGADEAVVSILKHECVHYALCVKGEPYDDGDAHFESELKRVGAPSTETNAMGVYGVYRCDKCGTVSLTGRKRVIKHLEKSTFGFTTRCCRSKITYIKTDVLDGTETIDEYLANEEAKQCHAF